MMLMPAMGGRGGGGGGGPPGGWGNPMPSINSSWMTVPISHKKEQQEKEEQSWQCEGKKKTPEAQRPVGSGRLCQLFRGRGGGWCGDGHPAQHGAMGQSRFDRLAKKASLSGNGAKPKPADGRGGAAKPKPAAPGTMTLARFPRVRRSKQLLM